MAISDSKHTVTTYGGHMTTRRRRQVPIDVQLEIEKLAGEGFGGKAILEQLERAEQFAVRLPDVRTVQRIVSDLKIAADAASGAPVTDPWTAADDQTGEPAVVLELLGALIKRTSGSPIQ